jgi:threonine/homoserine/homoserine lactone efflux protein
MTPSAAVAGILGTLLIGAMSPGPSFVVIARTSIGVSRRQGIATALGMGIGGGIFGVIALFGFYAVLASIPWLYLLLKLLGGLYLLYIAYQIWRGASSVSDFERIASRARTSTRRSLWMGLTTQLSNPKAAIFYGSIFSAWLPQHPPVWCYLILPPAVFSIEAGWYVIVAVFFSDQRARQLYTKVKKSIDRCAAVAIAMLGVRLILTANKDGI